jgi:hypothetical protein
MLQYKFIEIIYNDYYCYCCWLFELYLQVRSNICSNICSHTKSQCQAMWINAKGEPEIKLDRLVTRFFTKKATLHMTTTAMVEMVTHDACLAGHITATGNVNGHSAAVVRDYYIKQDLHH